MVAAAEAAEGVVAVLEAVEVVSCSYNAKLVVRYVNRDRILASVHI